MKEDYPEGPWTKEPDHATWLYLGLLCFVRRVSGLGHLCGYVQVPKGHPLHGFDPYGHNGFDVHGGVTYSAEAEVGGGWDIGFDCAHCWDITPMSNIDSPGDSREYRTFPWVVEQTNNLAKQIALT